MNVAGLEAEHVARGVKGADLPAPVGEQLGDPDHAGDDFIDMHGRLALGVDLHVAAETHGDAERAEA